MNKVTLMGRIGKDLETVQKGDVTITKFTLATNDGTKDKPKTNWHDIVAFGKAGEILAKYVGKGDQLLIIGELNYNTVENDNGKRTFTSITLKEFDFVGSSKGSSETTNDNGYNSGLPF